MAKSESIIEKEISTFEYSNQACSVYIKSDGYTQTIPQNTHMNKNQEVPQYIPLEKPIHSFLFIPKVSTTPIELKCSIKKGLILKEQTKAARTAINMFLSINDDDPNSFCSFTQKYGPLFPVDEYAPYSINYDDILILKKRLSSVFELIPLLNEKRKNYSLILDHVLNLLTGPSVSLSTGAYQYVSCEYPEISSNYKIPSLNYITEKDQDNYCHSANLDAENLFSDDCVIFDSVLDEVRVINEQDEKAMLRHIIELDYPDDLKHYASLCLSLLNVYTHYKGSSNTRLIIDFLYNLGQSIIHNTSDSFVLSSQLSEHLLKIADYLVANEITHNIRDIRITCSSSTFSMNYSIPSLLSAMYWSLLFLKDRDIYQKCPVCGDYFVPSNMRQKYCSRKCGNRLIKRKSREKASSEAGASKEYDNPNTSTNVTLPLIHLKEYTVSEAESFDDNLPF